MAKQRTKLKDFFEGKRRRCRLQDIHILKEKESILRAQLFIRMPLSNQPADGMNENFTEPYIMMAKEKSVHNYNRVAVAVDNASFHIFATDTSSRLAIRIPSAAYLKNFTLIGEGEDDKRMVYLEFEARLPVTDAEDDPLTNWMLKHLHGEFFIEAVPSQMEIEDAKSDPKDPPPNGKKSPRQAKLLVN